MVQDAAGTRGKGSKGTVIRSCRACFTVSAFEYFVDYVDQIINDFKKANRETRKEKRRETMPGQARF